MVPPTKLEDKQHMPTSCGQEGYYWILPKAQKVAQMVNTGAKLCDRLLCKWRENSGLIIVWGKARIRSLIKAESAIIRIEAQEFSVIFKHYKVYVDFCLVSCGSLIFQLYLGDQKESKIEFERWWCTVVVTKKHSSSGKRVWSLLCWS